MALLVDTSVWSLAFRRDAPPSSPEVGALRDGLQQGHVVTTGIVVLEVLRGLVPSRARDAIRSALEDVVLVEPQRADYPEAADMANSCRRAGVQLGTVDCLIAQLAVAGRHVLLTTDRDFTHAAPHVDGLTIWPARS